MQATRQPPCRAPYARPRVMRSIGVRRSKSPLQDRLSMSACDEFSRLFSSTGSYARYLPSWGLQGEMLALIAKQRKVLSKRRCWRVDLDRRTPMDFITRCRPDGAGDGGWRVACIYPAADVLRDLAGVLRTGNSVIPPEGYSLKWFRAVPGNDRFVNGFLLSLQVHWSRRRSALQWRSRRGLPGARAFAGREAVNNLLMLPLIVPGIVLGIASTSSMSKSRS